MRFHTYYQVQPRARRRHRSAVAARQARRFSACSPDSPAATTSRTTAWTASDEGNRSLDALKQAILDALMESGQFTPEMLEALRGGDDEEGQAKLAQAARPARPAPDRRGLPQPRERAADAGRTPAASTGPGSLAKAAARDVQFNLTDKGIDFLGYKTLRNLLGLARQVELRQPRHARISRRASSPTAGASSTSSATS